MGKRIFSKEILQDLYWNKMLSLPEIAKKLNTNPTTIRNAMKEYGISRRDSIHASKIYVQKQSYEQVHKTPTIYKQRRERLDEANEGGIEWLKKKVEQRMKEIKQQAKNTIENNKRKIQQQS